MITRRPGRRPAARLASAVLLALLTAACWWGWAAWDDGYRTDPVTGASSGPYEPWQVVGCVVCLVALAVLATLRLPAWTVVVVMPVAFTAAWSWTAASNDSSGLWVVGAGAVLVGTLLGAALVSGVTVRARRRGLTPGRPPGSAGPAGRGRSRG